MERDPGERDYISRLVREIGEGGGTRIPTADELAHLRDFFAHRVLRPFVDTYIQAKYDEHVGHRMEWPEDAEPVDYLSSLRETVLDQRSAVYVTDHGDESSWSIYFVGPVRRAWRGTKGSTRLLVAFNAEHHFLITGFQPPDGDAYVDRQDGFWVYRP